jgi:hypothetical protein
MTNTSMTNHSWVTIKLALQQQADEKTLRVSPPYSDPDRQSAFISGYDACLADIARGWLKVKPESDA